MFNFMCEYFVYDRSDYNQLDDNYVFEQYIQFSTRQNAISCSVTQP